LYSILYTVSTRLKNNHMMYNDIQCIVQLLLQNVMSSVKFIACQARSIYQYIIHYITILKLCTDGIQYIVQLLLHKRMVSVKVFINLRMLRSE